MYRAAMLVPRMSAAQRLYEVLSESERFSFEATTHAGTFFQEANFANLLLLHRDLPDDLASALCHALSPLAGERAIVIVDAPQCRDTIGQYYESGATSYILADDSDYTVHAVLENALSGISRPRPPQAEPGSAERQEAGTFSE